MSTLTSAPSAARVLFWFRRDLRLQDNAALYHALTVSTQVLAAFIFDRNILTDLPAADRRVEFIFEATQALHHQLREHGSGLHRRYGSALEELPKLARELGVQTVYANEDYEPAARQRDADVARALEALGIRLVLCKDIAVFEKDELLTQSGQPYTVFTPYKRAWLRMCTDEHLQAHASHEQLHHLAPTNADAAPTLENMGFTRTNLAALGLTASEAAAQAALDEFVPRIDDYHQTRDYPAVKGVSYLSIHNRFGTLSIRQLARTARDARSEGADTWLSELIWRDFFFQILFHYPHSVDRAFRPEYDALAWPNRRDWFEAWCEGRTGYPIVDAAMRQLNQTGFMHNRLRMISASFLVKDLLIDWRWGERYFARQLNDFDLSANVGNWQWAASTGCDPQPYFRIFNPITQSKKFDPEGKFIRRYVPELSSYSANAVHAPWTASPAEQKAWACMIGRDYPEPLIDHATQRLEALALYRTARGTMSVGA